MKTDNTQGVKLKGEAKTARIPIKVVQLDERLKKPEWIRVKSPSGARFHEIKDILRQQKLHTVCEEASCPNIGECFGSGTATFMIMGDICTRRCPFCDVAHGRPNALDPDEPRHMAETIANLGLKYAVITSVDRDDLRDGGAQHFADCIQEIRQTSPETLIEVLVPDFRGRLDIALKILSENPPDVFNHNIETVPRLYRAMRPGSDYAHSLDLLRKFKQYCPDIPTKCGLMVGLGEVEAEVIVLLNDLSDHWVDYVTIGQYLQPSKSHAPIQRFVSLQEFEHYQIHGKRLGFKNIWSAPMVRSSYFADLNLCPSHLNGINVHSGEIAHLFCKNVS